MKTFIFVSGTKERRQIQDNLRKKGTFKWNTNSTINNGEHAISRRPNQKFMKKATDYKSCPKCLDTYLITNIRHHVKKCTNGVMKGERSVLVLSKAVEGRIHETANDRLSTLVFPVLQEDDVVLLIRYDWLVIIYGNHLCDRYTAHFQLGMIRNKLRVVGRLLAAIKSICPDITDFASAYQPKYYDVMIKAIKIIGKFDPVSNDFGSPSTAKSAVIEVKKIGEMLRAESIKTENEELQKKTENFLILMQSDVSITIYKIVYDTQAKMKRAKKENIPSTTDVKRLSTYLET